MSTGRHRKADGFTLTSIRARHRRLFALVAIIAVFLQTIVVQTHIDGLTGLQSTAAIERANGSAAHVETGSHDTQSACPICQAMATAGTTVLASLPSLLTTLGLIAHEARLPIRLVAVRPAHAWQSRAPPIAL